MKRFILSILCVSVFFIGIGSIVEKTSAKFTSDDKAVEIINKARAAIGGGQNLAAVRSMTIVGTTTHFFEKEGIQDVKQGSVEINMQLPGQFSKMVKIGDPNNLTDVDAQVHKELDVIVKDQNGETVDFISKDGNKKGVFVIKRGEGNNFEWKSNADGKVKVEGDKIIITKDDGTTEEIKIDGNKKHKIFIKKDADGNIVTERIEGEDGDNDFVFKTKDGNLITEDIENIDGKKVIIMKDRDGQVHTENFVGPHKMKLRYGGHNNEMLRTTIALLMKAPEGTDVSYKFAGEGNVDGNPSNMIDVSANGSKFRLFIDASTNLPQMISFNGRQNTFFFKKGDKKGISKEEMENLKKKMHEPVERQIKFSDFRSVGGLLLPHRWSESVNNKQSQTIDITSYEINPANISEKFKKRNIFIKRK